jgi:hypothetical protein
MLFVENLLPPSTDSNWTLHANAKVISDSSILLTATGNNQTSTVVIPVLPNQTYVLSSNISTNAVIEVYEGGNWRFTLNSWETSKLFTTTSAATSIQLSLHNYTAGAGTFYFSNLKLERGSTANPFVPYGRWYLPYDYATGQTKTYITESFNSQRQTFSDALTSETITDKIEVLKTPQRHVKVTQATEGTWVVGDTIKVNSDYGVISGVGAVVGVISESYTTAGGNVTSVTLKFTDASKFTVGDTFMRFTTNGVFVNPTTVYTVTSVDAVSVTFTTNANVASFAYYSGDLFIETTSPSSDPTVTATGIAGTWSGLGTKTATYTITTAPTDNKCDILIQYAVNYPAGKGLVNLPTDVLSAEVNGQKLVSGQTVQIKANFDGKTANNTDLIPHKIKKVSFSDITTVNPSTSGTELTQSEYNSVFALDGSTTSNSTATSGEKVGYIIPFDLIRLLEDKLGEQVFADCANTASKVAKLKGTAPFASPMIDKIQCDWWGYGSSPSGNKASFKLWNAINSNWVGSLYHTNASVTKLTGSTAAKYQHEYIDSNGFVHFLAFAEPAGTDANGNVVASTINTDYCELSVSLKLPSGTVLTPENQMPVLSDNLLTSNQAFPVDLSGFTQINTTLSIDSLGVLKIPAISTNAGNYYGFSIDAISIGNKTGYHTFSCRFKGQNGIGYRVFFYDGSTRTDIVSFVGTGDWQTIKGSASRLNINQGLRIDGVGSVGADLTFYVSNLKVEQGNNPNPVWTAGRRALARPPSLTSSSCLRADAAASTPRLWRRG